MCVTCACVLHVYVCYMCMCVTCVCVLHIYVCYTAVGHEANAVLKKKTTLLLLLLVRRLVKKTSLEKLALAKKYNPFYSQLFFCLFCSALFFCLLCVCVV